MANALSRPTLEDTQQIANVFLGGLLHDDELVNQLQQIG